MHIRARHYATGELTHVTCTNRGITSIGRPARPAPHIEAGWVAPAFFDLQINGCDAHSFSSEDLTTDSVRHVIGVCRRHGIGSLCPTLVTNSFAALAHGMKTIREARAADPDLSRAISAIH